MRGVNDMFSHNRDVWNMDMLEEEDFAKDMLKLLPIRLVYDSDKSEEAMVDDASFFINLSVRNGMISNFDIYGTKKSDDRFGVYFCSGVNNGEVSIVDKQNEFFDGNEEVDERTKTILGILRIAEKVSWLEIGGTTLNVFPEAIDGAFLDYLNEQQNSEIEEFDFE